MVNAPGPWSDVRLMQDGGLPAILKTVPVSNFLAADSAFPTSDALYDGPKIRRPPKQNEIAPPTAQEDIFTSSLISVRQSVEWGMRIFQNSYPRLKTRLVWENRGFRSYMLRTATKLVNFRSRVVGLNQISSTWANYMDNPAELDPFTYRLLNYENRTEIPFISLTRKT